MSNTATTTSAYRIYFNGERITTSSSLQGAKKLIGRYSVDYAAGTKITVGFKGQTVLTGEVVSMGWTVTR